MRFIKLSAVSSTNDFLKDLVKNQLAKPYTVVSADEQTAGRGQRATNWTSEAGKNLMFSVLISRNQTAPPYLFVLNAAIAVSIFQVLKAKNIPNLSIKWPNDIMSGTKKISGILIENTLSATTGVQSIVGIGLNVNQTNFQDLPNASSLAVVAKTEFDADEILKNIVTQIKHNVDSIDNHIQEIWDFYNENLFRRNLLSNFILEDKSVIEAEILGVNQGGQLVIEHENQQKRYDIKQIQLIY